MDKKKKIPELDYGSSLSRRSQSIADPQESRLELILTTYVPPSDHYISFSVWAL